MYRYIKGHVALMGFNTVKLIIVNNERIKEKTKEIM